MARVEANGIQVHYEFSGREDAPVVVLSHSLGSSLIMWEPQVTALGAAYRVLRYDTRGHGETDVPEGPYTLEQLGQDALALLHVLDLDRVHFVGLSMGGMIGQYLALNHPERLHSLVLCDTAALMPEENQPVWEARIQLAREAGMEALVDETLERWFTPGFMKTRPEQVEVIRTQFLKTSVEGYNACSEAIRRLDYLERLSGIETPTLIMVGEQDLGTPVAASEAMQREIAESTLVVLLSAAHLSNVEQAEIFNRNLLDFLSHH
jgi:3-oxoadipate enol-lactonase